ncbi:radical SAM protein, partial [Macrococcus capreoli]
MSDILLISNFEGGFQPLTIASAGAYLQKRGFQYTVLDTYVEGINVEKIKNKKLIAISIPLFDSVNAAVEMV